MDSQIYQGSIPSFRAQLDLGSIPLSDISILQSEYQIYFPESSIKDSNTPVQFVIPSSSSQYLDLASSFLYCRLQILKSNGDATTSTDEITGSHNFFACLWDSIEVIMNGTLISKSPNLYPYRMHLLDLLTHGTGYKSTKLTSQLYYPDTKPNIFTGTTNEGFVKRMDITKQSAMFEMIANLSEAIFSQTRYLVPGVDLRITLRRSDPQFALTGKALQSTPSVFPYKISFDSIALYVKKHIVHPQVMATHHKILSGGKKLQYPLKIIEMRTFNIAKGSQTFLSETLFRSNLPEFIVITFVDSVALNGSVSQSCFNFEPFDIQSIVVSIDGSSSIYRQLDFDSANNIALLGYNTLASALNNQEYGNAISRDSYLNGNFCIVLDLYPSNTGNQFQSRHEGQLKLDLRFKSVLQKPINCIVLAQFQNCLTIDNNRNVSLEINN